MFFESARRENPGFEIADVVRAADVSSSQAGMMLWNMSCLSTLVAVEVLC